MTLACTGDALGFGIGVLAGLVSVVIGLAFGICLYGSGRP